MVLSPMIYERSDLSRAEVGFFTCIVSKRISKIGIELITVTK